MSRSPLSARPPDLATFTDEQINQEYDRRFQSRDEARIDAAIERGAEDLKRKERSALEAAFRALGNPAGLSEMKEKTVLSKIIRASIAAENEIGEESDALRIVASAYSGWCGDYKSDECDPQSDGGWRYYIFARAFAALWMLDICDGPISDYCFSSVPRHTSKVFAAPLRAMKN